MLERFVRLTVDWVRSMRRTTALGPLLDALQLRAVLRAIPDDVRTVRVLGPEEFVPYLRCLTPLGSVAEETARREFAWVIVPQAGLGRLSGPLLRGLRDHYRCVFENRRYVLFASVPATSELVEIAAMRGRLDALLPESNVATSPPSVGAYLWKDRAVLVTTFERPAALERSLPQIARLGASVLVVDDGSSAEASARNRAAAAACGASYLHLPTNRGLSAALNVGLEFLLADSTVDWVSYLQDDVDVRADLLTLMHTLEDRAQRPVLTGYDAMAHATLDVREIAGLRVQLKRETAGVHLHAHREYWRAVLPIPTEYLGAPKRRWEAPLEDSWITVGAPASAARRGIPVVCAPGLVRTFLWHAGDSTWDNPNAPEAPLGPPSTRALDAEFRE